MRTAVNADTFRGLEAVTLPARLRQADSFAFGGCPCEESCRRLRNTARRRKK